MSAGVPTRHCGISERRAVVSAPFTYPDDPAYVLAAKLLRNARAVYFAAANRRSQDPDYSEILWIANVEYEKALANVRAEEDRILGLSHKRGAK